LIGVVYFDSDAKLHAVKIKIALLTTVIKMFADVHPHVCKIGLNLKDIIKGKTTSETTVIEEN